MSNMENSGNAPSGYGSGMEEQHQELGGSPGGIRGMASQAGEKLMDTAEHQKEAGAQYMTGMAGAVRRAASEFDEQMPQAAQYIRMAADQIETVSDSLRRRDVGQMVSDVQSFARRQPAAFLGISLVAGFAAMRFLRSSAPGRNGNGSGMSGGTARMAPVSEGFADEGRYKSSAAGSTGGMPQNRGM